MITNYRDYLDEIIDGRSKKVYPYYINLMNNPLSNHYNTYSYALASLFIYDDNSSWEHIFLSKEYENLEEIIYYIFQKYNFNTRDNLVNLNQFAIYLTESVAIFYSVLKSSLNIINTNDITAEFKQYVYLIRNTPIKQIATTNNGMFSSLVSTSYYNYLNMKYGNNFIKVTGYDTMMVYLEPIQMGPFQITLKTYLQILFTFIIGIFILGVDTSDWNQKHNWGYKVVTQKEILKYKAVAHLLHLPEQLISITIFEGEIIPKLLFKDVEDDIELIFDYNYLFRKPKLTIETDFIKDNSLLTNTLNLTSLQTISNFIQTQTNKLVK